MSFTTLITIYLQVVMNDGHRCKTSHIIYNYERNIVELKTK